MTNPNDNAFPNSAYPSAAGLTKREYFAAMALQGLHANRPYAFTVDNAGESVKAADALIAALNKEAS